MPKALLGLAIFMSMASLSCSWANVTPIKKEYALAQKYLLENISPADGLPGAILASPSKDAPNYYFHWVRDAGLITQVLAQNYISATVTSERSLMLQKMKESISFDRLIQKSENPSAGLGEPKFFVNGLPFTDPWGRPQYDGPAIRATSAIMLAEKLMSEGQHNFMDGELTALIQDDLDFVAKNWMIEGFDIWEEMFGMHYYTGMVQYRALMSGAHYFSLLKDTARERLYTNEALRLSMFLKNFYDSKKHLIIPTIRGPHGTGTKISDLDNSILLGVLHGSLTEVDDDYLLNSVETLREKFAILYPINQKSKDVTLVGRYPEDIYDGIGMEAKGGNAWFITTHGVAELHCKLASKLEKKGAIVPGMGMKKFLRPFVNGKVMGLLDSNTIITDTAMISEVAQELRTQGMRYLERTIKHGDSEGRFSEQINRISAELQGARDLSWSYASFITAAKSCTNDL